MAEFRIETERLVLRDWRQADVAPFHAMGQDAEVMRFLGPLASRTDAQSAHDRMVACQADHGLCFWAIERREDGAFIGFCGLKPGKPPIEGELEIGWRLARDAWGRGYAREVAAASLEWGWVNRPVATIAAITVAANVRSWGLMKRLGMRRYPAEDFAHPDLPGDSPLSAHVLYRAHRPSCSAEADQDVGSVACNAAAVAVSRSASAAACSRSASSAG